MKSRKTFKEIPWSGISCAKEIQTLGRLKGRPVISQFKLSTHIEKTKYLSYKIKMATFPT